MYLESTIPRRSSRIGILAAPLFVLLIAGNSAAAGPQTGQGQPDGARTVAPAPAQEAAAGLTLVCEVYCSETKLRTANARIRWKLVPGATLDAAKSRNLSTAPQRLETTVYKNGFDKDLYLSLPISPAGSDRAVPSAALSRQGQATLRAYQIRLVDVATPKAQEAFANGAAETVAVVENLEPGMSYTWRLVIQAEADRLVSPTVRCRAPVCPADMVREKKP